MGLDVAIKRSLPGFKLNIDIACENGIVGVLGASGSGKSMLLNCITGLVNPDEGKIILNEKTLFDSSQKVNLHPRDRRVGFLFQNYALFPHMTIFDNIAFGLGSVSKEEKSERVSSLIERFHLTGMEKRYPSQISGGQQQRVALARAMAAEPEILLLDEPFSALDNHLKNYMLKEMQQFISEFHGITIFVTHNVEEAYQLCDRIAILKSGSVEAYCGKHEIFQNPISYETAKITGCKNLSAAKKLSTHTFNIHDWGIKLNLKAEIDAETGFIGIRQNHIRINESKAQENTFDAWIVDESEAPFKTNLYLKIGSLPNNPADFHIQAEISSEQRSLIEDISKPLSITFPPEYVFFMHT